MITKENYHDPKNRALSRSKIMDYLKSKAYFKAKHIDCTIVQEPKKAFDIGNGVDALLAQIEDKHKFVVFEGDRRTKLGKEEYQALVDAGNIVLTKADYETIMGLAMAVEETDAYKEIVEKKYTKQFVLELTMPIGEHFDCLVAMPDYILMEGDTAHIWDLKTASSIDPRKYRFHCEDYGYFMQMAIMQYIIEKNHPHIKKFVFGHIAVEKEKDVWNVQPFRIDNGRVELEKKRLAIILGSISKEKDFKKYNPKLSDAISIGAANEDYE